MRSLLLILTLIMTLGQAVMPAAASVSVSEHQPMAAMDSSASTSMAMDCCQGQQHCPDCGLGMDCGTMGNCASHCTPGVSLLTASHPLMVTGSQPIALPSWSLQTAILSQQTPPPNSAQM